MEIMSFFGCEKKKKIGKLGKDFLKRKLFFVGRKNVLRTHFEADFNFCPFKLLKSASKYFLTFLKKPKSLKKLS